MKIITTFYRRVIIMVRPLDDTIPERVARLPVVREMLRAEDVEAYRAFHAETAVDAVRARLARGDECLASWHEGRIVHAVWASTGQVPAPYLGRELLVRSGSIYFYDSFTLPAYCGYGLADAASAHFTRHYRRRGYRRQASIVAAENMAGLRLNLHRGSRPIGRFSCLRLGRWQYDWHTAWGEQSFQIVAPRKAPKESLGP